ncbi:MAG: aminotransferase class IV [Kiritimatiellae bacterium]|nr:aminotransferase class IV [Kiritimatiellia bacterium]
MRSITRSNFLEVLKASSGAPKYYAFYSSLWDGITTDPSLMVVPVDDHVVHRGDGVFDSALCAGGKVYNFGAHIDRLYRCADAIGLSLPWKKERVIELSMAVAEAGGHPDCALRIIASRGPGSLGAAPVDCSTPALYIVAYARGASFMELHPGGGSLVRSAIPAKAPQFARVKSCNYLQNALMKEELAVRKADFICSFDAAGFLAEGPTENVGIVTKDGILAFPLPDNILAGTTMLRCIEFGEALAGAGVLKGVERRNISEADVLDAAEVLIVGTTTFVVSIRDYEGHIIGDGRPGPVAKALGEMLFREIGL